MKFHIQGMPKASVELTDDELRVLQWAARNHYDGKCKDQVHWLQFERDWLRDIGCARGTTMITFDRHRMGTWLKVFEQTPFVHGYIADAIKADAVIFDRLRRQMTFAFRGAFTYAESWNATIIGDESRGRGVVFTVFFDKVKRRLARPTYVIRNAYTNELWTDLSNPLTFPNRASAKSYVRNARKGHNLDDAECTIETITKDQLAAYLQKEKP